MDAPTHSVSFSHCQSSSGGQLRAIILEELGEEFVVRIFNPCHISSSKLFVGHSSCFWYEIDVGDFYYLLANFCP